MSPELGLLIIVATTAACVARAAPEDSSNDGGTDAMVADVPPDTAPADCGTDRPDLSGISASGGALVIASDGTIYYGAVGGNIGRMRPGMAPENTWVPWQTIGGPLRHLALSPANDVLYATNGSAASGSAYVTEIATRTSSVSGGIAYGRTPITGIAIGPDGVLYASEGQEGNVRREDASGGVPVVNSTAIEGAGAMAFGPDGSLYVASASTGTIWKLTLVSGQEAARSIFATNLGSTMGIAFDVAGRLYYADSAGGHLIRLEADGTAPMVLAAIAASGVAFGAGSLRCTDIYAATTPRVLRYEMGTTPGAAVPWHH